MSIFDSTHKISNLSASVICLSLIALPSISKTFQEKFQLPDIDPTVPCQLGVLERIQRAKDALAAGNNLEAGQQAAMLHVPPHVGVYIDTKSAPEKERNARYNAIVQALKTWEKCSNGLVSFSPTDNESEATIKIYLCNAIFIDNEFCAGYSKCQIAPGIGLVRADISIALNINGLEPTPSENTTTTLHEIGHVCGLGDFNQPGSVMNQLDPLNSPQEPSKHEIDTVCSIARFANAGMKLLHSI